MPTTTRSAPATATPGSGRPPRASKRAAQEARWAKDRKKADAVIKGHVLVEAAAAITELQAGVAGGDVFSRWLAQASRFPRYSDANQWLIMAQAPEATYVASESRWTKLGYTVNANPNRIGIFMPSQRPGWRRRPDISPASLKAATGRGGKPTHTAVVDGRVTEAFVGSDGVVLVKGGMRTTFRVGKVVDRADVTPGPDAVALEDDALAAQWPAGTAEALERICSQRGLTTGDDQPGARLPGMVASRGCPRGHVPRPVAGAEEATLHGLAHVLTDAAAAVEVADGTRRSAAQREVEAAAAVHLISRRLRVDTGDIAFDHVLRWLDPDGQLAAAGDTDAIAARLRACTGRVMAAAAELATELDSALEQAASTAPAQA